MELNIRRAHFVRGRLDAQRPVMLEALAAGLAARGVRIDDLDDPGGALETGRRAGGKIDDDLRGRTWLPGGAQQDRRLVPVRLRSDGFVRNEAAVSESPQQVVEGRDLGVIVQPDQYPFLGMEGLLDFLAGEPPALSGIAAFQHVKIRALHAPACGFVKPGRAGSGSPPAIPAAVPWRFWARP